MKFASLVEAYHGDTLGAIGVGYSALFHQYYRSLLPDTLRLSPPHVFRFCRGLSEAGRVLAAHHPEIAAVGLRLPILVVVGSKLGALNHALLTFECAQARSAVPVGLHLQPSKSRLRPSHSDQRPAGLTDVPCLGCLPFVSLSGDVAADSAALSTRQFDTAIDVQRLLG